MGRLRSHPAPLDPPKLDGWHVVLPHRHQGSKPYRRGSASLGTQEPAGWGAGGLIGLMPRKADPGLAVHIITWGRKNHRFFFFFLLILFFFLPDICYRK